MLDSILTGIGLSKEQIDVYQSLLKHGNQTAIALSKTTKVKRTYVYKICEELIAKGLAKEIKQGRTTLFTPLSPDLLLDQAQAKRQQLEQTILSLESVLPNLKSQYQLVENKPLVTYYEGKHGLHKILSDVFKPKNEPVYGCVDLEIVEKNIPDYYFKDIVPVRIKNQVFSKAFFARSNKAEELSANNKTSLRETVLLDKDKYPIPAEIDVYEDKIALLNYKRGKFVGVLIENEDLATSLKSIFRLAFESNKK